MKRRLFFVGNSSSSSFYLNTETLSDEVKQRIRHHIQEARGTKWWHDPYTTDSDAWSITEDAESKIWTCSTFMDNFYLREFIIEHIGVPEELIQPAPDPTWDDDDE